MMFVDQLAMAAFKAIPQTPGVDVDDDLPM